jgi:hypothetical protein
VVGGDFNAAEDEPHIEALPWIDIYRAAHPGDAGPTCCTGPLADPGEATEPYRKRIDYLFLVPEGRPVEVVSVRRVFDQPVSSAGVWLRASDHAGLLAVLDLAP